jgi:hypothetical protein
MKLIAASLFSWLVGIGAYVWALWAFWGQRVSSGDLNAVLFWSAFASTAAIVVVYAPVMFALRERLDSNRNTWWAYATVGAVLGVLPVGLITRIWSPHSAKALVSPEAMLFFCMFAVFGAVFGAGFFFAYCRGSASEG